MRGFLPLRLFGFPVLIAAFGVTLCSPAVTHAATTVSNVRAGQRAGTKLVDIDYDITGTTGWVSVAVQVSSDAGASYAVPAVAFTGDSAASRGAQPARDLECRRGLERPLPPLHALQDHRLRCPRRHGADPGGEFSDGSTRSR